MHTSDFRSTDFSIKDGDHTVLHADYFVSFSITDRVGIVIDHRFQSLDAATILIAHVTAFYDRCRSTADEFFAYPDFFAFQRCDPLDRCDWFDIWPEEKNVVLSNDPWETLSTIVSRGVNILLVPDAERAEPPDPEENRHRATLASLERNLRTCYAYGADGDLSVSCTNESLKKWGFRVVETDPEGEAAKKWEAAWESGTLTQACRRIDRAEAIGAITGRLVVA